MIFTKFIKVCIERVRKNQMFLYSSVVYSNFKSVRKRKHPRNILVFCALSKHILMNFVKIIKSDKLPIRPLPLNFFIIKQRHVFIEKYEHLCSYFLHAG